MAYNLDGKLKIAVSTRALFHLEMEDEIFREKGLKAYEEYQQAHEEDVLTPGVAFPLVKALLGIGPREEKERVVEIFVVSRNTANTCLRVFNSIEHYGLDIMRGLFTGGEPIVPYLKSLDIDLYLTANDEAAKQAIDAGIPAATLVMNDEKYDYDSGELRVAFDGDAVLFSEDSEVIFKTKGLDEFTKNEKEKADEPMKEGPMFKFLRALSAIQSQGDAPIRTALVTARSAPSHKRMVKTLRSWGINMNEIFFLGGINKSYILQEFKPQIFFDDQHIHTDKAAEFVPSGTVPYKSGSVLDTNVIQ